MNNSLFSEISKRNEKKIFYGEKILDLKKIKFLINQKAKKISKFKRGIVSISTQNKLNFIINFYACNKANFPVFLNDNASKKSVLNEKIIINYVFKNDNLIKINKKFNKNYFFNIIIKSSGASSIAKYVYLKDKTISHVCKEMNKQMFSGNKKYNELIFAPLYHAFGFGRLHSLMKSENNISLTDFYSISSF